jgi:SAM-dependent methyltransferase
VPGLAALGFEVLAIDRDPPYVQRARRRAEGLPVRVVEGDLADLDLDRALDLVVSINGPFTYLLEPEHRRRALAAMFRALVPGGTLILEHANLRYLLEHYAPPPAVTKVVRTRTVTRIPSHYIDPEAGRWVHEDQVQVEGEAPRRERFAFAMLDQDQTVALLGAAGFTEIRCFAGWTARVESATAGPRMLISARRTSAP